MKKAYKSRESPLHLRNLFLILKRLFLSKDSDLSKDSFLSNKGSALISVIVASTIGAIVILGVGTSIVNQSNSQKKIKNANKQLWKVMQIQSIIDKFSTEDTSRNKEPTLQCLNILNDKINIRPQGFDFVSRDCLSTDSDVLDCSLTDKPKIIELTGTGTLPKEWDIKIPVLSSQCCSLFYEDIIREADADTTLPSNIKTKITNLGQATLQNRKTKVKEIIDLIIDNPTPLTYATQVCGLGNSLVSSSGGDVCNSFNSGVTRDLQISQTDPLCAGTQFNWKSCNGTNSSWVAAERCVATSTTIVEQSNPNICPSGHVRINGRCPHLCKGGESAGQWVYSSGCGGSAGGGK